MCGAFSGICGEVRLIIPSRVSHGQTEGFKDIYGFYGVGRNFNIKIIQTPDFLPLFRKIPFPALESVFFLLQENIFARRAVSCVKAEKSGIVFTRSRRVLKRLVSEKAYLSHRIVYECHRLTHRETAALLDVQDKTDMIVAITSALRDDMTASGIKADKILVCPDGADTDEARSAAIRAEHSDFRNGLEGKFLIGYAGSFSDWKGVITLIKAAEYLADDCRVLVAGGSRREFLKMIESEGIKEESGKIKYMGYLKPRDVFSFIKTCDLMAVPNSAKDTTFSRHSSPLKLFEAMACGVPVIGSDLPSISEIIRDGENGFLSEPDDPRALAEKIMRIKTDSGRLGKAAAAAKKESFLYSWRKRAGAILDSLGEGK
ncbi:MAG: glycosyltransferase family 4 protein [bacterium]|nr:glycosyltransferase family 4 protein [bacterium]